MQRFETDITFTCPACAKTERIEVEVPELDFSSDKSSEHTSEGEVYFTCPACNADYYGYAFCDPGSCSITLEEHGIELDGDPPMYSPPDDDDWTEYDVPDNPHRVFDATYDQMMNLLDAEIDTPADDQIIARMIFSQIISAMEAFLADTLITEVFSDEDKLRNLLAKDIEIKKQQFTLKDIASDKGIVENTVKAYLRKILYHNLGKVHFLYKVALNIDLKINENEWKHLHKAILHRHDCVHRNGFNSNGEKNEIFTKDYVKKTAAMIKRLVDSVDNALSPF